MCKINHSINQTVFFLKHPPVRGGNFKTFRWDHRLQVQLFLPVLTFDEGLYLYRTGDRNFVVYFQTEVPQLGAVSLVCDIAHERSFRPHGLRSHLI